MLRLPPFAFHAPASMDEAVKRLSDEPGAKLLAGGTDLFPNMKRRQQAPRTLISLGAVPGLAQIWANGGLHIGAMASLEAIAAHPAIRGAYAALAEAAFSVSTPQLRTTGTIGGNICLDTRCNWYDQSAFWRAAEGYCMKTHADVVCRVAPSSPKCLAVASADTVPALLALGARLRVRSAAGERELDLDLVFNEDGIRYLTLAPGDVVTGIDLPAAAGWRSTYLKMRDRGSFDFPIAGVAAAVRLESGSITAARIAITAVGSRPLLVTRAAEALIGQPFGDDSIRAAADACLRASRPVDNTSGTIAQRRRAVLVLAERALRRLAS